MSKYPLSLYLLPFILLLIVIIFIHGSGDFGAKKVNTEKPALSEYKAPETKDSESEEALPFESRIPVYPGAIKAALKEGAEVKEAAFFTTTDPIDTVKDWYVESLGGYEKVNMIDIVNREGLRVVTVSLPDTPKELVEIKEQFKGAKDLLITITTLGFYTRHQPKPLDPAKEQGEKEKQSGENTDKSTGDGENDNV